MFTFSWNIPGDQSCEVVLRIHSSSSWFGRKSLAVGAQSVCKRGWFEGVETRFHDPATGQALHLSVARIPNSVQWRPVLLCDGRELPEQTRTQPPRVAQPPKLIAMSFGFVYLMMFLAVVMLPSTIKILMAMHQDDPSYMASQHTVPWIIPMLAAAVSMLAVLNMRKWAVLMFAALIVAQAALLATSALPISMTALAVQALLWLLAAVYWGRMD